MLKIENVEVLGWEAAIRGMRNPMNSWEKSDSFMCEEKTMTNDEIDATCGVCPKHGNCDIYDLEPHFIIGPNDHELMMSLAKGGAVHAKYRRMITVYMDITAPLYWWKEFDTYKVGTVANSCSTMHKIHAKEFTLDDFSHEHLISRINYNWDIAAGPECRSTPFDILEDTIHALNIYREKFLETNDKKYWWQMIQLLPSSYNQKRTVMLNYEVLSHIYKDRRNHKLDEWHVLCDHIERLPYSEVITMKESKE